MLGEVLLNVEPSIDVKAAIKVLPSFVNFKRKSEIISLGIEIEVKSRSKWGGNLRFYEFAIIF